MEPTHPQHFATWQEWLDNRVAEIRARDNDDLVFTLFTSKEDVLNWAYYLRRSPTSAFEFIDTLVRSFPDCQGVRFASLDAALWPWPERQFDNKWCSVVVGQLHRLSGLKLIDFSHQDLDDNGLLSLATMLPHFPNLQTLILNDTLIGNVGLTALAQHAPCLLQLRTLSLDSTLVDSYGVQALVAQPKSLAALADLNLGNTADGDKSLEVLATHGRSFPSLRCLAFNRTQVGDHSMEVLAAHARDLVNLRTLFIHDTEVTPVGLKALARAVHFFKSPPEIHFVRMVGVPYEVATLGATDPSTFFEYCRSDTLLDKEAVNRFALLIVGQGNVGKTHLKRRLPNIRINGFCRYYYATDPDHHRAYYAPDNPPTHDVEVDSGDFFIGEEYSPSKESATCLVLDFGGQNELHSTHRLFLRGSYGLFLLVLRADLPADGDDIKSNRLNYWLRLLAYCGRVLHEGKPVSAPVVIAVTQSDRIELRPEMRPSYRRLLEALKEAKNKQWCGANVVAEPILGLGWSDDVANLDSGTRREIQQRDFQATRALYRTMALNVC